MNTCTHRLSSGMLSLLIAGMAALCALEPGAQTTTRTIARAEAAPTTGAVARPAMSEAAEAQARAAEAIAQSAVAAANADPNIEGLRFNFRGAPLETVLDYLSAAAGFVIVKQTAVSGTVDIISHKPLNLDEAVALLNAVLSEKGLAAIRKDRTLTIVNRSDAKTMGILPVRTGANPQNIPATDEMVTQIIPVKYADVKQLVDNIEPLLPENATLSANEGSNALILTDTQINIRRMAEIIEALDTSIAQIAQLKVFPLQYADAEEIAKIINDIFQARANASRSSDRSSRFRSFFSSRGGPPFGGPIGGDSSSQSGGASVARQAQTIVTAVADTRTNSLVVSAPEEYMPAIEDLVKEVDTVTEDITLIQVFPLRYADATETAQTINDVFKTSSSASSNQSSRRFGGPFGFFGGMSSSSFSGRNGAQHSERKMSLESVTAVADTRTNSVIVRAAAEVMEQIRPMIQSLDANPAKNRKVSVHSLDNADVDEVGPILESLFGAQTSQSNARRNTTTQGSSRSQTGSSSRSNRSSQGSSGSSSRSSSGRSSSGSGSFGSLQ